MLTITMIGIIILVISGIYLKKTLSLCSGVSCFKCFITLIIILIVQMGYLNYDNLPESLKLNNFMKIYNFMNIDMPMYQYINEGIFYTIR